MRLKRLLVFALTVGAALIAWRAGSAQSVPDAGRLAARPMSFVTLLGRDTIAVEDAVWAGDSLTGNILVLEPSLTRYAYVLHAAPGGGFQSVRIVEYGRTDAQWRRRREARVQALDDSVEIEISPDNIVRRVLGRAALLSLPGSGALLWFAAEQFDRLSVDSASIPWIAPLGGLGGRFIARRRSYGFLEYRLSGGFAELRRDPAGNVLSIDARATTLKLQVMPATAGVLAEALGRWNSTRGGLLSPRDTVRASIGGVELRIDYGRPSVRGREVFAHGVLGDSVWRTGANAATQLRTTESLRFASGVLPAGDYSLFTRIDSIAATLLINSRHSIWGTQYDPGNDLLCVPMHRRRAGFVEQLRISIDSVGPAIVIHWADQEFRVPFAVQPERAPDELTASAGPDRGSARILHQTFGTDTTPRAR